MILWGLAVQTKGLGIWFVCSMKPLMADCKLDDGSEDAALQALLGELGEVALHGVEPRAGGGRELEGEPLVAGEPGENRGMLVSGIIVENDMDGFTLRDLGLDGIQEADELLMAVSLHAAADDLAFQDVESGKERDCSVALIVMGHCSGTPFLQGQAGLGSVQSLNLALFIHREHDGVLRRIDIEPDDVAQRRGELRIVGELELLDLGRLKTVGAPDALNRAGADAASLSHHRRGPVRGFSRRRLQRQLHHPLGDVRAQLRDAGGPRLVAQKTLDTFLPEPFLPAPDGSFGRAGPAHDLVRAKPLGRKKHDLGPPDMLLWRVAVLQNRPQPLAVRWLYSDGDSCAHAADSHAPARLEIPSGSQMSDAIH